MAEFSSETVQARDVGMPFKELKKIRKKNQWRILYPAKSFLTSLRLRIV